MYFSPRPRRCLVILYAKVKTVKGSESLFLLREPSTDPSILQKSGLPHSFRQFRWWPQNQDSQGPNHLGSSCPCCWSSPTVGLLPASPSDALRVWPQLMWIAKECGQGRQYLAARQRHKGVRICSPVGHVRTQVGTHMHEAAVHVLCRYTGMERDRVGSQCRHG